MTALGGGILAWLTEAIREREYVAQRAADEAGQTWREDPFLYGVRDQKNAMVAKSREDRAASIVHIAAADPDSVLRRCTADRKLLKLYAATVAIQGSTSKELAIMTWAIHNLAEGYGWTEGKR